jgi:hypothetical protein
MNLYQRIYVQQLADNVPAADTDWMKRIWDEARLKLAVSHKNEQ